MGDNEGIKMNVQTFMKASRELGQARLSKDENRIKIAEERFKLIEKQFLEAEKVSLGLTIGELSEVMKSS
jgi:hypothetical protein